MLSTVTRTRASVRVARTYAPALARCYGNDGGEGEYQPRRYNPRQQQQNDRYPQRSQGDRYAGRAQGERPQYQRSNDREPRMMTTPSTYMARRTPETAPSLLTLADRSVDEITALVKTALQLKLTAKNFDASSLRQTMNGRSLAMIFSKRSTRTRVATETSVSSLGGVAMFLGSQDIQLGVNESLYDSAKVIGSMVNGIMARVNGHEEVETLAKHAGVPVINALSDLYHPTQILADILTLVETYNGPIVLPEEIGPIHKGRTYQWIGDWVNANVDVKGALKGKKMAWIGDTNNITNELLVTLPRFGMEFAVAAPKGYDTVDPRVVARLEEQGVADKIIYTNSPAEAIKDADILVTDTWISMGQEEEAAARIKAFDGYQITMDMVNKAGAKPDWKFMHCLPRHKEEVDDEVFYSDRSVVFPEAENRKWTIMACIDAMVGNWRRA